MHGPGLGVIQIPLNRTVSFIAQYIQLLQRDYHHVNRFEYISRYNAQSLVRTRFRCSKNFRSWSPEVYVYATKSHDGGLAQRGSGGSVHAVSRRSQRRVHSYRSMFGKVQSSSHVTIRVIRTMREGGWRGGGGEPVKLRNVCAE